MFVFIYVNRFLMNTITIKLLLTKNPVPNEEIGIFAGTNL